MKVLAKLTQAAGGDVVPLCENATDLNWKSRGLRFKSVRFLDGVTEGFPFAVLKVGANNKRQSPRL